MTSRHLLIGLAALVAIPIVLLALAVVVVQSPWAERWLEARLTASSGREIELERIRIGLEWPPAINLGRLRIANPSWAKTPHLVDAESLHANVELLPLLHGRLVMPFLSARKATAGLEVQGPRATWQFGVDSQEPSPFAISRVQLDDGDITFRDEDEHTALRSKVRGSIGQGGALDIDASGQFRGEPAKATAHIPALDPYPDSPIQLSGKATIGSTEIVADGSLVPDLKTIDMKVQLAGQTLKDLHNVLHINLPDTPPYRIAGQLRHSGSEWVLDGFDGKVGDSDLAGTALYRKTGKRPFFQATLKSRLLDLDDLGPVIGAPPKTGPGQTASAKQKRKAAEQAASTKVLPQKNFSTENWDEMDADVRLDAKRVRRPKELPIDALSTHLVLKDSVLRLAPLSFGVAGGHVSGTIALDGRSKPGKGDAELEVQGLQLARLFPDVDTMKQSLGTLYGRGHLTGRGTSVADLLGSSNGQMSFAINSGHVSLLLVELLGIDIAEALPLLGTRNRQVNLRCAVADFNVKDGVAAPQAFVIDTDDTVVPVEGTIDFKREMLALVFRPQPKDTSIFVLRSPVHVEGPFKRPAVRPEAGPIAARVGAAVLLAAVNPLLAILPFIETGPGQDSDCGKLLAEVKGKGAVKKQ